MFEINPFFIALTILVILLILETYFVTKLTIELKRKFPDFYKKIGSLTLLNLYKRSYQNSEYRNAVTLCEKYRNLILYLYVMNLVAVVGVVIILSIFGSN